jgi:excisionase family DNA binding protein
MKQQGTTWTPKDTRRLQEERIARSWTPAEVAEILKISPSQVRHLIQSGKIRGFKVRGKWYVERDVLQAYLESSA